MPEEGASFSNTARVRFHGNTIEITDIYEKNRINFAVGKKSVRIFSSTGARQDDALSTSDFNLASKPLIRAGKCNLKAALLFYISLVKTAAYADEIAVTTNSPASSKTF
jgi:hypothetical protein